MQNKESIKSSTLVKQTYSWTDYCYIQFAGGVGKAYLQLSASSLDLITESQTTVG